MKKNVLIIISVIIAILCAIQIGYMQSSKIQFYTCDSIGYDEKEPLTYTYAFTSKSEELEIQKDLYEEYVNLKSRGLNVTCLNKQLVTTNQLEQVLTDVRENIESMLKELFHVDYSNIIALLEHCIFLNVLLFTIIYNVGKFRLEYRTEENQTNYFLIEKRIMKLLASLLLIFICHYIFKRGIDFDIYSVIFLTIFLSLFLLTSLVINIYDLFTYTHNEDEIETVETFDCNCVVCDIEEIESDQSLPNHTRLLVRDTETDYFYILATSTPMKFMEHEYVIFTDLIPSSMQGVDYDIPSYEDE